jgi:hypothetical protein
MNKMEATGQESAYRIFKTKVKSKGKGSINWSAFHSTGESFAKKKFLMLNDLNDLFAIEELKSTKCDAKEKLNQNYDKKHLKLQETKNGA